MRIACIHVPQFPLQAATRAQPAQVGRALVVVGEAKSVLACSRAAHALGARVGQPVATLWSALGVDAARVSVVTRRATDEVGLLDAVADALAGLAPGAVDRGGAVVGSHHALYCGVPVRSRGPAFGQRVREALRALGVRARIGIADDRFTAWVAASQVGAVEGTEEEIVSVPRGGSAAFLAPRPLSLLAIPAEVQSMLATLGVRTLGQFAALPPPSAARAWDADLQALARGDAGAQVHATEPLGPLEERLELADARLGLGAAVALLAERVAARLPGRPDADAIAVSWRGAGGASGRVVIERHDDPGTLAQAIGVALAGAEHVIELRAIADDGAAPAAPQVARGSGPIFAGTVNAATTELAREFDAEPAAEPFRLTAPTPMSAALRQPHRRTRRGKQRTRATVAAQARLFGGRD